MKISPYLISGHLIVLQKTNGIFQAHLLRKDATIHHPSTLHVYIVLTNHQSKPPPRRNTAIRKMINNHPNHHQSLHLQPPSKPHDHPAIPRLLAPSLTLIAPSLATDDPRTRFPLTEQQNNRTVYLTSEPASLRHDDLARTADRELSASSSRITSLTLSPAC